MYITDLTHFLDDSGAIGPTGGPARAMAQFLADVVAHVSDATSKTFAAPLCFKCKKRSVEAARAADDAIVWVCPACPTEGRISNWQGSFWDLRDRPSTPPPGRAGRGASLLGLSTRIFLLSTDDMLYALANAAFLRMLRQEDIARAPDFAGQRVRQASVAVELLNGKPSRLFHQTFSMLDFDAQGWLDVERLSAQQFARVDDPLAPARFARGKGAHIIDAARRFVFRGGSWAPDEGQLRRIEAAALGRLSCPRVRVVR